MDSIDQYLESARFIQKTLDLNRPKLAIFTGTGLNSICDEIDSPKQLDYQSIPNFPLCTVKSHGNRLLYGTISGIEVLIFDGRFHYYEGYSMDEITYPIRVLQQLGIDQVLFTNAAGGLNPNFNAGDIILAKDHIYLMPENPLRGKNNDQLGIRFPDMSKVYDKDLGQRAIGCAKNIDVELKEGVYVCWQGPSLETPAEYKFLNTIGADMVGMSTIPEVIVAKHANMKITMLSVITNVCYPPEIVVETTIEEVIEVATSASSKLSLFIKSFLQK